MLLLFILVLLVIFLIPVYRKPLVLPNFITENEIDHIKNEASKNFKISTVSQNATVDEEVRKSDTAWLELSDPIIKRVVERCVSLTDRPFVNVEKLQVLRYGPGGF